jgi:hypothetical protein
MISAPAVFLRAGWSLGNTIDRYIFSGAGSDQIVGRSVSGLPLQTMDFAVLPPHFTLEDIIILSEKIRWECFVEHYDKYPTCFKKVIPFLLASITYHYESGFLQSNLVSGHPIWSSQIFTSDVNVDGILYPNAISFLRGRIILSRNFCPHTSVVN